MIHKDEFYVQLQRHQPDATREYTHTHTLIHTYIHTYIQRVICKVVCRVVTRGLGYLTGMAATSESGYPSYMKCKKVIRSKRAGRLPNGKRLCEKDGESLLATLRQCRGSVRQICLLETIHSPPLFIFSSASLFLVFSSLLFCHA
ncbi:hypothetical protein M441DRAFT_318740 [Trichoderma asperellum CBS 433.97]|uniref:Uncharacterized protein n=1 Tax=Trichoderma asperellum (strain ATCC 204424 / CBS 433.97 / NBRC 101777) TaxID=1042311 RepID=A0A2T3ZL09_TRIA4|nr:hypothetical protein M441DRAFT_318740 [Trichoderma asperellum CBS 433.97]PTB45494.1 hypothetical protein M441DRAFT_318740 [Trichoderma asperellum CBS 433.97]